MTRPTRYKPAFADRARLAYKLGACDLDVAELLNVSPATLYRWRHRHPDFATAAKVGREPADDRMELSLYQRGLGFEYVAERVFLINGTKETVVGRYKRRVLAHPAAALQWLRIRRPEVWRVDAKEEEDDLVERLEEALRRVAAAEAPSDAQG